MVRPLLTLVLVAIALPAQAARDLPPRIGMYPQQGPALPMLDSDVTVVVRGPIAEATIVQTFKNDSDHVTEATYIFPLPPDATVSAMAITTGTRTIHAGIEARDKATARYEKAVAAGVGAGLLEQERPDVFTQTVSAIPAHGTVTVTLRFDTVARYAHGTWELALPLVIAPRYVPGGASGRPTTGTGRAPDTDRAPDASRVTPGGEPGAGGSTTIHLSFEGGVDGVTSPTHELEAAGDRYTLIDPATDHDAIVRWRSKATQQGWVEPADDGGVAAVLVEAKPTPPRKGELAVRLVLDRAATTKGDADAVERAIVRGLLGALTPRDRVAVAGSDSLAATTPEAAQKALDELWRKAAGPFDLTSVLTGLRGGKGALVLVSDGLVADDKAALAAAAKLGAPLHVIGVGPAPNRSLLTQLATSTGGTVRFAVIGDDLAALARETIADAASPPEPVAITWGTLSASDVVPAKLPRVGSGQALLVLARIKKAQAANARARGDVFGFTQLTVPAAPAGATTKRGPLARRWAKVKLDDLIAAGNATAIRDHALKFGLVSPATAMVAIGQETVVKGGVTHTIAVPVSVPAGMQWQLVKQQTTVDTKLSKNAEDKDETSRDKSSPKKSEPTTGSLDLGDASSSSAAEGAEDAEEEKPEVDGRRYAAAPTSEATMDEMGVESVSLSQHRRYRLAASLGGGLAFSAGDTAAVLSLGAHIDIGSRRTVFGADASLWFVDGLHGEGGFHLTVTRRAIAPTLELGTGLGVRFTGDAIGPAAMVVLRLTLPVRGLGGYLRYDGALLGASGTWTGQHAGSIGIEARW